MVKQPEPPLVDSHFHIWRDDLPLIRAAWHKPPTNASVEQALELLDTHGVTFGVIAAASLYGTYNDYVRAALLKHRRLRATAIADPGMDIYQLEQMKRDGFVGIRFVWSILDEAPDINSDGYRMLLKRVADLDWHVHLTDRPHRIAATIAAVAAIRREAGDRPSRSHGHAGRNQRRRVQEHPRGDRARPHLGQALRRLPLPSAVRGGAICGGAVAGRRRRAAGLGQRLAVRRATRRTSPTRARSRPCTNG